MGDKKEMVSKAMEELVNIYHGVPDDSVDLTMKDLAVGGSAEDKKVIAMESDVASAGRRHSRSRTAPAAIEAVSGERRRFSPGAGGEGGGGGGDKDRRPGIPHTNLCSFCSSNTYLFRQRCLVCGRAYCRNCVQLGMGDMKEGRKCIDCLGVRFSPRYITRAGKAGCLSGLAGKIKQQELIWADMGPNLRRGSRRHAPEAYDR